MNRIPIAFSEYKLHAESTSAKRWQLGGVGLQVSVSSLTGDSLSPPLQGGCLLPPTPSRSIPNLLIAMTCKPQVI